MCQERPKSGTKIGERNSRTNHASSERNPFVRSLRRFCELGGACRSGSFFAPRKAAADRAGRGFGGVFLEALWRGARQNPAIAQGCWFPAISFGQARLGLLLGSALPGQGDSRAAIAGPRARVRLLELSGLCAGHAEPHCRRAWHWISRSFRRVGPSLLLVCWSLRHCLRGVDCRPLLPALFRASYLALAACCAGA